MADDDKNAGPAGAARAAGQDLLNHVRALADTVRSAGSAITSPLPLRQVEDVLGSLRDLVDSAPAPAAALEVLVAEVTAKRALIGAMQEQLVAFDTELALLERALSPVHEWSKQWTKVQDAMLDVVLHRPRD